MIGHTISHYRIVEKQSSLTDRDIEELIRFFQLLHEWDLEHKSECPVQEPTDVPNPRSACGSCLQALELRDEISCGQGLTHNRSQFLARPRL
jgi:hypothetical protein